MKAGVAALCLGLIAQTARADDIFPAGAWYTDQQTRVEHVYSISHYEPDGSFSNDFRECWNGGSRDHTEKGHWLAVEGQMHEVTESISGKIVNLTAEYEVSHEGDIWTIRVTAGDALRVMGHMTRRLIHVAEDATMPICDPTS